MRYFKYSILIVGLMASLAACRKDKNTTEPSITGSWRIVPSVSTSLPSYFIFAEGGKAYQLTIDGDQYREVQTALYKFSNGQLEYQYYSGMGSSYELYNIVYSGDTMVLRKGLEDEFRLLRDNLAPAKIEAWAAPVQVNDMFTDTAGAEFIAWAYSRLVTFKSYSGGSVKKFIEYNPATRQVSNISAADRAYRGADYMGSDLWCVEGGYVYKYSPGIGAQTFQSAIASPSNGFSAMAAGEDKVFAFGYAGYQDYNALGNSWSNLDYINPGVSDMAFLNGYLYVVRRGFIYQMHPYYKVPGKTWFLEGYELKGIAHDGSNFWLSGEHMASGESRMLKVTLP